jgi:hypothetical protein
LSIGRKSEEAFERAAKKNGLTVIFVSTHRDAPKIKTVRHFPDYFVVEWACFVQVKNGKNSGNYPNVIAEQDSIDTCKKLFEHGNEVMVVWDMPDGSFYGNRINELNINSQISDAARQHGSGTPAYKISKTSIKKIFD